MTEPTASFAPRDHFAHCIQVLGGVTAASRRLDIDERAIRRFVNGERPLTVRLLTDTATALRRLIADAQAAEADILAACAELPNEA
jgi:hypothetical protein